MRSFVVIGLGKFGFNIAKTLYELGQEVTAIDTDKEIVQKIQEFSTQAVVTDATVAENLLALGVDSVDVGIVSMGERMDASILIALHLKEMGVPEIWVKAMNEDHGKILKRLGVTEVIHVEKEMALRIAQSLSRPNVIDYLPISEGYSIQEFAVPVDFTGKSLAELDLRRRYGVYVIAVKEVIPERVVLNPEADFIFKDSDIMVILGSDKDLDRLKGVD